MTYCLQFDAQLMYLEFNEGIVVDLIPHDSTHLL